MRTGVPRQRLRRLDPAFDILYEAARRNADRGGDGPDRLQRGVPLTPLQKADVGGMEFGQRGEFLLRQSGAGAVFAQHVPKFLRQSSRCHLTGEGRSARL